MMSVDQLLFDLYDIYHGMNKVLNYDEAMEVMRQYQSLFLRLATNNTNNPNQYVNSESLRKMASLWSLCILCFFQAPRLLPVQFLLEYNRWVQFYKADQSGWINHFMATPLFDNPPAQFWTTLLNLIASRHIEQACLLLRKLLLDSNSFVQKHPGIVELLLERLLLAPSPASVVEDPSTATTWVRGNAQLFSTPPTDIPRHLEYSFELICGRSIPIDVDGIDLFGAFCAKVNYNLTGLPTSYLAIVSVADQIFSEVKDPLDALSSLCLRFNASALVESSIRMNKQVLSPWFGCHLIICFARGGLVDAGYELVVLDQYIHFLTDDYPHIRSLILKYATSLSQISNLEDVPLAIIEEMDEDQIQRSIIDAHSPKIISALKQRFLHLCGPRLALMDSIRIYDYGCMLNLDFFKEIALKRYLVENFEFLRAGKVPVSFLEDPTVRDVIVFYSNPANAINDYSLLERLLNNQGVLPSGLLMDIAQGLLDHPTILLTGGLLQSIINVFERGILNKPDLEMELRIIAIKMGPC